MPDPVVSPTPEPDTTAAWWRVNTPFRVAWPAYQRVLAGARNASMYFAVFYPIMLILAVKYGHRMPYRGSDIDPVVLVIAYPTGVVLMGAIVGLLLPFMRHLTFALLAGILGAAPLSFGVVLAVGDGRRAWATGDTVITALGACFYGVLLGKMVRDAFYSSESARPHRTNQDIPS